MRSSPWTKEGRWIGILFLALLGSCGPGKKRQETVWPDPDLPELARVEILPRVITLHTPDTRQLQAVGFRSNGAQFDLTEYPDRFVCSWSLQVPPLGDSRNPSGILVTLMSPGRCKTTLYVSSDSQVQEDMEIPVRLTTQGPQGSFQEEGMLVVGAADAFFSAHPTESDWVQLSSTSDSAIVLLSGCEYRESTPPSEVDWLWSSGSGTQNGGFIDLEKNLTFSGCSRAPEVDVFSSDQGAWILTDHELVQKNLGDLWTDQEDDELNLPEVGYQARDVLDAYIYEYEGIKADSTKDLVEANKLFLQNLVGIEFHAVDATEKDGCVLDPFPQDPCKTLFLESCIGPEGNVDQGSQPLDRRLYVIFYAGNDASGGQWRGKTCKPEDTGGAQVVFLPTGRSATESLAHEFGHVLGHRHPALSWVSGHVREHYKGFKDQPERTVRNLMYDGISQGRDLLTVGQAFRMIVDAGSWYQIEAGFSSVDRQPGRACGSDPYEGMACPQIHWGKGTEPVPTAGAEQHGDGTENGAG